VLAGLGAIVLTSMCLVLIKKLKRRRMFWHTKTRCACHCRKRHLN
jgi:hypothetical protein